MKWPWWKNGPLKRCILNLKTLFYSNVDLLKGLRFENAHYYEWVYTTHIFLQYKNGTSFYFRELHIFKKHSFLFWTFFNEITFLHYEYFKSWYKQTTFTWNNLSADMKTDFVLLIAFKFLFSKNKNDTIQSQFSFYLK